MAHRQLNFNWPDSQSIVFVWLVLFGWHRENDAALLLAGSLTGFVHDALCGQYRSLANGEWPPYAGETLPEGGIGTHIVRAALAAEGITVEFDYLSWKRGLEIAKRGLLVGAILWVPLPEREADFLFSDPIMNTDFVLLYRQNKPLNSVKQVKGFQFGMANGYSYEKMPELTSLVRESGKPSVVVADDESGIKAVIQERIDLFPIDRQVGRWLLSNMPAPNVPVLVNEPPIRVDQLVVLFPRTSARSKWLQERMNAGLANLRASGQLTNWLQEAAHSP
ncbi:substrate-binding periplasmic protein [Chitinimonas sp. BJB300]|uniref:substrate-binding periplasmic protein n=1 Tax=Chitinimonas sp. BJB300 TaxID=1559339 RepID=UPI0013043397|nr:transporter substrate-binding domain-containing protein [Chitinimonas sp. BJB300]